MKAWEEEEAPPPPTGTEQMTVHDTKKYLNNIKNRTQLTMLNQKTVIYIILSAILLYLYYKRGGIALFVAFVVVVAGTLFAGAGANAREGLSLGGGGGKGDKECAKMGFTETKIDKKNIIGSLKKINDSYKKTLLKYGTFNEDGQFELKKETGELLKPIGEDPEAASKIDKAKNETKDLFSFIINVYVLFMNTYNKSDSGEMTFKVFGEEKPIQQILDELNKEKDGTTEFKKAVISGESLVKKLNEVSNLDVTKNADKKTKEAWKFLICAMNHAINNIKKLDKTLNGGDDAGGGEDDEEEKSKKKKKKSTKKKSKKKDEDDEDEE